MHDPSFPLNFTYTLRNLHVEKICDSGVHSYALYLSGCKCRHAAECEVVL